MVETVALNCGVSQVPPLDSDSVEQVAGKPAPNEADSLNQDWIEKGPRDRGGPGFELPEW